MLEFVIEFAMNQQNCGDLIMKRSQVVNKKIYYSPITGLIQFMSQSSKTQLHLTNNHPKHSYK